jgi:competence protein ComGC
MKTIKEVLQDKRRATLMFILMILIIAVLIVMVINKDNLFKSVEKVTYKNNNCSEIYVNGKLNSSKCPEGNLFTKNYSLNNIPIPILADDT